jgi:pantetheine-phosphate adenylyltransferase
MKTALFAGSFDPPTRGHIDIIERAAKLFKMLYVGVAKNSGKHKVLLTVEERVAVLKKVFKGQDHIKIVIIEGLTVDFAKENHVDVLVRSLRNGDDFSYEASIAYANKQLSGIETLFLASDPIYSAINGSIVREIAWAGGDISSFVPENNPA